MTLSLSFFVCADILLPDINSLEASIFGGGYVVVYVLERINGLSHND